MKTCDALISSGFVFALCLCAPFAVGQTLSISHPGDQVEMPLSNPLSERSMQLSVDPSTVEAAANSYKDSVRLYSWSTSAEVQSRIDASSTHAIIPGSGVAPSVALRARALEAGSSSTSWWGGAVTTGSLALDLSATPHSRTAMQAGNCSAPHQTTCDKEPDSAGVSHNHAFEDVIRKRETTLSKRSRETFGSGSQETGASSRMKQKSSVQKAGDVIPDDSGNPEGVSSKELQMDLAILGSFDPSAEIRDKLLNGTWKTDSNETTHFASRSRLGPRSWRLKSRNRMEGKRKKLVDETESSSNPISDSW